MEWLFWLQSKRWLYLSHPFFLGITLGLLRALRSTPPTCCVGFILVTGKPTQDIITTGQKLGMNNMIKKPFTLEL